MVSWSESRRCVCGLRAVVREGCDGEAMIGFLESVLRAAILREQYALRAKQWGAYKPGSRGRLLQSALAWAYAPMLWVIS